MFGKSVAAIVIIVIVAAAIFIALYSHAPSNYDNSKLKIFLTVLAGLGIFVTFFFYYNVVELQYQQQASITYENIEKLNDNIAQLYLKGIDGSWEVIPKFIASLMPTVFTQAEVDVLQDEDSEKAKLHKYLVSHKVFFLWRDYITYYHYILKGTDNIIAYLTMFLQRAHSPYLKTMWVATSSEYNAKVISLGELLFLYSSEMNTDEDYRAAAEKLVEDARYKELVSDL